MKIPFHFFVVLIVVAACSSQSDSRTQAPFVASVNGRNIDTTYFEETLQRFSQIPGMNVALEKGRFDVLKDLIDEELLFQAAVDEKVYLRDPEVKSALARAMVKHKLKAFHTPLSDEALKKLFEEQKDSLEKVRASHILVQSKSLADRLHAELSKSHPERFADYARQHSQDASNKDKGGDLGWFTRGQMVPEFSSAAFALTQPGQLSPVIQTSYGYHLIQLSETHLGFEAHRLDLLKKQQTSQGRQQMEVYLKQLQDKAQIQIMREQVLSAKVLTPIL